MDNTTNQKISPAVLFAIKYCYRKGLYTTNPISGYRECKPQDIWKGIFAYSDYMNRNRGNNSKKKEVIE